MSDIPRGEEVGTNALPDAGDRRSMDERWTAAAEKLQSVGQVFVLDQHPQKLRCAGFLDYHSSPDELPLYDKQADRLALFNAHQDHQLEGLLALLAEFGPQHLRVICEQFNMPIQNHRSDLERVHRVEQARLSDTHGIRAKIAHAFATGSNQRFSVLSDRRATTRFAAHCLNAGIPQVIMQGQPTGYRAETMLVDRPKSTIIQHAHANVSDATIGDWIADWKKAEDDDEVVRHEFVQQQAEQCGLEEGLVGIVYGGNHWGTGTRDRAVRKRPLEGYLRAFQRIVVEPVKYAALIPQHAANRFSDLDIAGIRRLMEGVRVGKLS